MTETVGTGQSHEEPLLDHCMYLGSNKAMLHTEQQLQAIVDIIIRVADPEQIILFGSRARGDARPDCRDTGPKPPRTVCGESGDRIRDGSEGPRRVWLPA